MTSSSGQIRLGSALLTSAAGRAAATSMSVVALLLATRLLDPAEYGKLALLLASSTVMYAFVGSWSLTPTYVLAAQELRSTGSMRRVNWARLRLLLLGSIGFLVILSVGLTVGGAWERVGTGVVLAWSAASVGYLFTEHVAALLETGGRYRTAALLQLVRPISYAGLLGIGLLIAERDAFDWVLTALAISWVVAVACAVLAARQLDLWPPQSHRRTRKILWQMAAPLTVHAVCQLLFGTVDLFMVKVFLSDAEVGHYGLAYQAFTMALVLASAVAPVLTPRLAAAVDMQPELARHARHTVQKSLPLLGAAVACAVPLVPVAVRLVFGADFNASAVPVVLLMPALLLITGATLLGPILTVSRLTVRISVIALAVLTVNVVLDVLLITALDMGIAAPAVATSVAALVSWVAVAQTVKRVVGTAGTAPAAWLIPTLVAVFATLFLTTVLSIGLSVVAAGLLVYRTLSQPSRVARHW